MSLHYYRVSQKCGNLIRKFPPKNHTLKFITMPYHRQGVHCRTFMWMHNCIPSGCATTSHVDLKVKGLRWFHCAQTYHSRPLFSITCIEWVRYFWCCCVKCYLKRILWANKFAKFRIFGVLGSKIPQYGAIYMKFGSPLPAKIWQ